MAIILGCYVGTEVFIEPILPNLESRMALYAHNEQLDTRNIQLDKQLQEKEQQLLQSRISILLSLILICTSVLRMCVTVCGRCAKGRSQLILLRRCGKMLETA